VYLKAVENEDLTGIPMDANVVNVLRAMRQL
jgi:hypothetical protein